MKVVTNIFFLLEIFMASVVAAGPSAMAAPTVVRIGATLPLSGRLALAGTDARQGIQLAIKDFSSPSLQLEVVFDDNQHDLRRAAASAHKLLSIEKVDVPISMWDVADVVAPMAERKQVPHLSVRWDPHVTERYTYTFTFESTYRSYVDSLITLLRRSGVATVALLVEEAQGWGLAHEYFKKVAQDRGITLVGAERFVPLAEVASDLRPIILRAVRNKPQMLVVLSNPPYTEIIIKQLRDSVPHQKFTGYFEIIDPHLVENIPFVAQFEVEEWFAEKFQREYGSPPRSRAAQVYDMVHLIALAAERIKSKPPPDALLFELSHLPEGKGATGTLRMSTPRVVESECVLKIAKDGEFQVYR